MSGSALKYAGRKKERDKNGKKHNEKERKEGEIKKRKDVRVSFPQIYGGRQISLEKRGRTGEKR